MSFVAEAGEALVGFATAGAVDDVAHLYELSVRHEDQGRGVGKALIAAVVAAARARGLCAVTLTTFTNIAWNAPFYQRLGFQRLAAAQLDGRLAATLKREYRHGLSDRCAMRLDLI